MVLLAMSCWHSKLRTLLSKENPYENIVGGEPEPEHLKIFGCVAYIKDRKYEQSKFDTKARKPVFQGYGSNNTAYLL